MPHSFGLPASVIFPCLRFLPFSFGRPAHLLLPLIGPIPSETRPTPHEAYCPSPSPPQPPSLLPPSPPQTLSTRLRRYRHLPLLRLPLHFLPASLDIPRCVDLGWPFPLSKVCYAQSPPPPQRGSQRVGQLHKRSVYCPTASSSTRLPMLSQVCSEIGSRHSTHSVAAAATMLIPDPDRPPCIFLLD